MFYIATFSISGQHNLRFLRVRNQQLSKLPKSVYNQAKWLSEVNKATILNKLK